MNHGWNSGFASGGYALGFPWGGVAMAVLILALVGFLVFAVIRMGKTGRPDLNASRERGLDILIERYSRGEIDAEAFRAMKAELGVKN